jgi:D-aspartate ligase
VTSPEQPARVRELPCAVVVGLDCITGLQTARILAGHGVPVVGLVGDASHFAARTRVCRSIVETDLSGEAMIVELERLGAALEQKAVLVPCTDVAVLTISRHRDRLVGCYHVLLPDHDVVELLMDKAKFLRFALAHDLPVPRTAFLTDRASAERASSTLTYPCGLKPPFKSARWVAGTKAKVISVADPDEFLRVYDRVHDWVDELVAQEWVVGGDDQLFSCNAYFDAASQPLVTFVARKLRQWPPHTGTSSLGQECRNDVVLAETVRLFQDAGFHGLAYLEMKRDVRTGEHLIIEPNVGRPTGRSAIAEAGGVDLVFTAYSDAVGLPRPAGSVQTYGDAKWMDLRRDVQSALQEMRCGELTVRQWLASMRGRRAHAVLSLSDPAPFAVDMLQSVARALRGVRKRLTAGSPVQPQQGEVSSTVEQQGSRR